MRRRLGRFGVDFDEEILRRLAFAHRAEQGVFLAFLDGFFAIDLQPAGHEEDFAIGLENVGERPGGDACQPGRDLEFRRREKHRDETPRDHVVELLLGLVELAGDLSGGDDREVVGNLGPIENALGGKHQIVPQRLRCEAGQIPHHAALVGRGEGLEDILHRAEIILRQVARIGPRIGQRLVLLIKRLRQLQRAARGEAEAVRGLALERGQVVKQRRRLARGLLRFGDNPGFPLAARLDGIGLLKRPQPVGAGVRVGFVLLKILAPPAAAVVAGLDAEITIHFPVGFRHEGLDFFFPADEDGQRRRLHASRRGEPEAAETRIHRGQRAGGVDAHQPVALAAAQRGIGQRLHLLVAAQFTERLLDGGVGHRLHPQPPRRLFHPRGFDDVAENQLPLAPGVAGVDDLAHVAPLHEALEHFQAIRRVIARLQLEFLRQNRQALEFPTWLLPLGLARQRQLDQVPDRRGNDVGLVLKKIFLLFELGQAGNTSQHPRQIGGHAGFLGNDECFHRHRDGWK